MTRIDNPEVARATEPKAAVVLTQVPHPAGEKLLSRTELEQLVVRDDNGSSAISNRKMQQPPHLIASGNVPHWIKSALARHRESGGVPHQVDPAPNTSPDFTSKLTDRVASEGLDRSFTVRVSDRISEDGRTGELEKRLSEIERRYGIKIGRVPGETIWVEDAGIPLGNKGFLAVNFNRDFKVDKALRRLREYAIPSADPDQGRTAQRYGLGPDPVPSEGELNANRMLKQVWQVQGSQVFLEGGNVLATGDKVLVGRSSVIVSMALLDERGKFNPEEVKQIASSRNWPEKELQTARLMVKNSRLLSGQPVTSAQQADIEARTLLAKMDLTKGVIAGELNVEPSDVVTVSQPTFHIDMQMRPLEQGTIMLNDPRLTNQIIDSVLGDKSINLSSWEREVLKGMKFTEESLSVLVPVLEETRRELETAGFKVISAPGNSEYARSETETEIRWGLMNVMNGTVGKTPSGINLYITNGSGIQALDDRLSRWLKSNTSVQAVEFVNHRLLPSQGGFDCITIGDLPIQESERQA